MLHNQTEKDEQSKINLEKTLFALKLRAIATDDHKALAMVEDHIKYVDKYL
jgi:hypothetical protein